MQTCRGIAVGHRSDVHDLANWDCLDGRALCEQDEEKRRKGLSIRSIAITAY